MNTPTPDQCLNCAQPLSGAFCAACGQPANTQRFNTGGLVRQFLQSFTNLDRGFLHTAVALTLRPGPAMLEYVQGKRVGYYNPISYLLVFVAIWLLGLRLAGFDFEKMMLQAQQTTSEALGKNRSETPSKQKAVVGNQTAKINHFIAQNADYLELFLIPLYALLFSLFFKGKARNYSEIIVFHCFTRGHVQLFSLLILPLFASFPHMLPYYSFSKLGLIVLFQWWAGPVFFQVGFWDYTWRMLFANVLSFFVTGFSIALIAILFLR